MTFNLNLYGDSPAELRALINALRSRKTMETDLQDLLAEYYPVEDDDTLEDA